MAEAIFCHRVGADSDWTAHSAGVMTHGGSLPSYESVDALAEIDIDLPEEFTSSPVTEESIEEADWIVTMTRGHRDMLLNAIPEAASKTRLLSSFGTDPDAADIQDPVGYPLDVYRHTRDSIDSAIADLILFLRDQDVAEKSASSSPQTNTSKHMKIAIASDHGGYDSKSQIVNFLESRGLEIEDLGTDGTDSVDYPDFAAEVASRVSRGQVDQGILVCTTGIGMSITANKFPGVRAALCFTPHLAKMARTHNNANVLALPGGEVDGGGMEEILTEWFDAAFDKGSRHERRVDKIGEIERCAESINEPTAVRGIDPAVYRAIMDENRRQVQNIELIASENYASRAVRECNGSLMTNKYAEGYPGKRWYNGCENVDRVEQLAIDRAKELFGAEHANVQAHSGSTANQAVYFSVLKPGDTILSMSLAHGGHLTHGMALNFSGTFYNIVHYGVSEGNEQIDYDEVQRLADEHKPKMILCGASAYSRIIDFKRFREIADSAGAMLMADMAHVAGLVAAGCHPNPVPHCDFVTTTTHKTLRGPRGGLILCQERYAKGIDKQIFPGVQGGPLMHTIAAKAVCFQEALQPEFKTYQEQVIKNAQTLANTMEKGGLRIISGGTDNHVMLVDLTPIDVTGKDAAAWLDEASITVNKNSIPYDKASPFVTSGIRIGSPAVTTRGMKEEHMELIANWIVDVLKSKGDEEILDRVNQEVIEFTQAFSIP